MTANITTPYSEKIPMFFGLCSRPLKYYSTNEDIKTFLNKEFNNEHTQNLSSIIDKLIAQGFNNKDFKNALFCTEYNKHWLRHSNIFLYTFFLIEPHLIVTLISTPFLSQSAFNYLGEILQYAVPIIVGAIILAAVADRISVYCQNNSRLNELNSFFKTQNFPVGISGNNHSNIITNDNL